jgi:hypothetical protein
MTRRRVETPRTARRLSELNVAQRRQAIVRMVVELAMSWGLLFLVYFILPFDNPKMGGAWLHLVAALAVFSAVMARQILQIVTSDLPELKAIKTLFFSAALFIVIFASIYLSMSTGSPFTFSEPLNHVKSLYFTVTVLATVGFGDITPKNDTARMIVTMQMVLDLAFLAVLVRVIVRAAKTGLTRDEDGLNG